MLELNKIYDENCLNTMAKMPDCFEEISKEYCEIAEKRIAKIGELK